MQPVAKPREVGREPGLGRAVDIVGLAPPLPGGGRQGDDEAVLSALEVFGHNLQHAGRAHQIDGKALAHQAEIVLGLGLVRQQAEGQHYPVWFLG